MNVDLDGVLATITRLCTPLGHAAFVRIFAGTVEGEVPERFTRRYVQHADAAGFWRIGLADPFHAKVHAIGFIGHADDLVEREIGFDSGEFDSSAADVDGGGFLGENGSGTVCSEDADGNLNFLSRLAALSRAIGSSSLRDGQGATALLSALWLQQGPLVLMGESTGGAGGRSSLKGSSSTRQSL